MSDPRPVARETWWLFATPAAGAAVGTTLGAALGAADGLWGPTDEVGPFVGDPVASGVLGAAVGLSVGVLTGFVLGIVLMLVVGRGRALRTARLRATGAAAVVCPVVLLALSGIMRAGGSVVGSAAFATVAAVGAVTSAWLAGRAPNGAERGRHPAAVPSR